MPICRCKATDTRVHPALQNFPAVQNSDRRVGHVAVCVLMRGAATQKLEVLMHLTLSVTEISAGVALVTTVIAHKEQALVAMPPCRTQLSVWLPEACAFGDSRQHLLP